jgi:hypothetical protein
MAAIKEAFTFTPNKEKSVKQQVKEAQMEHEAPILSLFFKIIGFFIGILIRFTYTYVLYAIALPFKLGHSIIYIRKMKKLKFNQTDNTNLWEQNQ